MESVDVVIASVASASSAAFIAALSEISVTPVVHDDDRRKSDTNLITSPVLALGRITTADGGTLYLHGVSDSEQVSFVRGLLSEGALGAVVVVPSSEDRAIEESRQLVEDVSGVHGLRFAVAVEGVDSGDLDALEDVRSRIGLQAEDVVLGLRTADRESVKAVLASVLALMLASP